jgi:hypothetical protein
MHVNNRQNVNEGCDRLIGASRAGCLLSHPLEENLFVAAVAKKCEFAESLQLVKKQVKNSAFFILAVGPE